MPTDYSKGKIYKITCPDGKFYIGSTVLKIETRFKQHIRSMGIKDEIPEAEEQELAGKSKFYRHVVKSGFKEKDLVLGLLAENLGITTRDELLTIEDSHIREAMARDRKNCLNRNKPRATDEERIIREAFTKKMWKKLRRRRFPIGQEQIKQYFRENKYKLQGPRPEFYDCSCGSLISSKGYSRHIKTDEHAENLSRQKIFQKLGK